MVLDNLNLLYGIQLPIWASKTYQNQTTKGCQSIIEYTVLTARSERTNLAISSSYFYWGFFLYIEGLLREEKTNK